MCESFIETRETLNLRKITPMTRKGFHGMGYFPNRSFWASQLTRPSLQSGLVIGGSFMPNDKKHVSLQLNHKGIAIMHALSILPSPCSPRSDAYNHYAPPPHIHGKSKWNRILDPNYAPLANKAAFNYAPANWCGIYAQKNNTREAHLLFALHLRKRLPVFLLFLLLGRIIHFGGRWATTRGAGMGSGKPNKKKETLGKCPGNYIPEKNITKSIPKKHIQKKNPCI